MTKKINDKKSKKGESTDKRVSSLKNKAILKNREIWYNNTEVLFEIIKQLQARETAFLSPFGDVNPVRCVKAHYLGVLQSNLKAFHFIEKPYNLYASLAKFRGMPMFSYNPKIRSDQMKEFNKKLNCYLYGYDWGNDFDNHDDNLEECKKQTIKFVNLLIEYNITHYIKSSGSGFHVVIPWEAIQDFYTLPGDGDRLESELAEMSIVLAKLLNLPCLDTKVHQVRRIWKVAYSFDILTGTIAVPLTYEELLNFKKGYNSPKNVFERGIRDKGLPLFIGNSEGFIKLKNFCLV